jgi:hypothetical protein
METEKAILSKILEMREKTKCTKFVGAITIEILRNEFAELGLNVSNRDVFIEGVPSELDLLIAKRDKNSEENLVYHPKDVLAILEIRFRGSYGKDRRGRTPAEKLKMVFDSVRKANNKTKCFYVTVSESRRHKYRISKENIGYDCFELFTRETNLETALRRKQLKLTGEWQELKHALQQLSR